MRVRRASRPRFATHLLAVLLAVAGVTVLGTVSTATAVPRAASAPSSPASTRRQRLHAVPDAPQLSLPTTAQASWLAAAWVGYLRAVDGVVPSVPVDTTGFAFVMLGDVNRNGTAVGYGARSAYKSASRELVLLRDGATQVMGRTGAPEPLGDRSAYGNALNDHDVVTGVAPCQCRRPPDGVPASVAFRWSAADGFSFAPMPPGVVASTGVAINNDGVILVNSWASPSPSDDGAWLWNPADGSLVKLGDLGDGAATGTALNDDGTVVGYAPLGGENHAVLWRRGHRHRVVDLAPGTGASMALDINRDGTVVGWRGTHAAAWWQNGKRSRDLGEGQALAIDDHDRVVGNQVIVHLVPADGGATVDVTVAAVYDLWEPTRRSILDGAYLSAWLPVRLSDGFVASQQSLFGPVHLPPPAS